VEDPAFRDRIGEEVLNRLRVEPNRPVLTAPAVAR
jgi:hypothetical protein